MIPRSTVRFNVHLIPGVDRATWSLSVMTHNSQGIPEMRLLEHGAIDADDQHLVGIDALAQSLLFAVDRTA